MQNGDEFLPMSNWVISVACIAKLQYGIKFKK